MHVLGDEHSPPYFLDLILNDVPVKMELDTGAAVSIINEATLESIRQSSGDLPLHPVRAG